MAVVYWDPENGDDSNPGTADAPVATLNQAVTLAGDGGEVRCAGRQLTNLGTATFTYGSKTVTFPSDVSASVAAGDILIADGWPLVVSSVSGNTVTLYQAAYLSNGEYTVYKAELMSLSTRQTASYQYTDVTISFGWDLSTETQPADFATCFSLGAAINDGAIVLDANGTVLEAGGRLFLINNNNSYDDGIIRFAGYGCRVIGTLAGCCTSSSYLDPIFGLVRDSSLYIDELRVNYALAGSAVWEAYLHIRRCELWNTSNVSFSYGGLVEIGELDMHGTSSIRFVQYGKPYRISLLRLHNDITSGWSEMEARAWIDRIETSGTVSGLSPNIYIGGPVDLWQIRDRRGLIDKITGGRGGASDYCVRIDPSYQNAPVALPLKVPGVSSGTLTLQFYARYTGTSAPACWVECQGRRYEFSPQPADAWSDDQLVMLELSVLGSDSDLEIMFYVTDNAEGDALVYLDDITLSQGDTTWTVDLEQEAIGLLADPTPPTPVFQTPLTVEMVQEQTLDVTLD